MALGCGTASPGIPPHPGRDKSRSYAVNPLFSRLLGDPCGHLATGYLCSGRQRARRSIPDIHGGVEQGMRKKPGLAIKWLHPWRRLHTHIAPIRQQLMRVHRVLQRPVEQLLQDNRTQRRVLDGKQRLNAPIQVALHQVGAPQVDLLVSPVAKVENPAMLQETPYKASDADVLTHAGNTRAQAAYTSHDQVDTHPCLRCSIEHAYHLRVDKRIHLEDETAMPVLLLYANLTFDTLHDRLPQAHRGYQQLAIGTLARVAGERVEKIGGIRADLRAAGEQAEVLVDTRSSGVVVARSQVNIAH